MAAAPAPAPAPVPQSASSESMASRVSGVSGAGSQEDEGSSEETLYDEAGNPMEKQKKKKRGHKKTDRELARELGIEF